LRLVDKKADGLIGLVAETAKVLPEVREALPPALTDAIDDERRVEYRRNLDVAVRLVDREERHGRSTGRAMVEVTNTGDEVVSLLSMRLVGLDDDGNAVMERQTWAATPLQIEDEWRGPLLPHETRRFSVWCYRVGDTAEVTHEITDLRVWRGSQAAERDAGPEA
jgi:hypothetical protein